MDIAIITAFDQHRAIGTNGDLPWGRSLPADLANFKRLTTGGSIIMGRKTFESIGSRPLPDREKHAPALCGLLFSHRRITPRNLFSGC